MPLRRCSSFFKMDKVELRLSAGTASAPRPRVENAGRARLFATTRTNLPPLRDTVFAPLNFSHLLTLGAMLQAREFLLSYRSLTDVEVRIQRQRALEVLFRIRLPAKSRGNHPRVIVEARLGRPHLQRAIHGLLRIFVALQFVKHPRQRIVGV